MLRAHRVDRISVNPQTLDDRVLETIGRRHTAQDIYDALQLVRATGGFAVNMDLIAGLPGDTPDGFRTTLEQVLALAPENITVHTLSRKRGADLSQQTAPVPDGAQVGEMLDFANTALNTAGYAPYYLYRQKFMSGGFENVGWTRPGQENLYNICIMEELCSILAMGGGASTKLVCPGGLARAAHRPQISHGIHRQYRPHLRGQGKTGGIFPMSYQIQEINRRIQADPKEFVDACDAAYAEKIERAARAIAENVRTCPIVLLSGPSGSGKTTTAMKIAEALRGMGISSQSLAMDDYFRTVNPRTAPRTPEGDIDFESPACLDMDLLGKHLNALARGEEIHLPRYNFVTRVQSGPIG